MKTNTKSTRSGPATQSFASRQGESADIELNHAAAAFAALGSEQRLGILRTLVRAGPEGLSIGELGERSGVSGSTLTHHLKMLTAADLVEQVKQGRTILCAAVAYDQVEHLSNYLLQHCCADAGANNSEGQSGE